MEIQTKNLQNEQEDEKEEEVYLDEAFFVDDSYEMRTFTYGSHVLRLLCLQSASTDYDLTGQLVWPGAELLNHHLAQCSDILTGRSIIELGSGVGVTGLLCSRFCRQLVLTDHNEIVLKVLKQNIDLQFSSGISSCAEITSERLDWGNHDQLSEILKRFPEGFDLIIGADICFQQCSIPLLFDTVEQLLRFGDKSCGKFILAYVSRAKSIDAMVANEAEKHRLQMHEVAGSRKMVAGGSCEGIIFEFILN